MHLTKQMATIVFNDTLTLSILQSVPLATEPGISLIIFTTNEDIAKKFEADLPHCVRNVTTS